MWNKQYTFMLEYPSKLLCMERLALDLGACGQGMPPDNAVAVGGSKSRVILLLHQGDDLAVVLDRLTLVPTFFALQWP